MQSWDEIRAWRKAERARQMERRLGAAREDRARWNEAIAATIERRLPFLAGMRVGFYWPFKGEFDARPLVRRLRAQGASLALPVVIEKAAPLIFRHWEPGIRMEPGIWQIPVPAEDRRVVPEALLVPLLGFDRQGYRLGYGGGYYDRTFAAIRPKPLAVAVGFELAELPTVYPQPHDIPMDFIITERRLARVKDRQVLPVADDEEIAAPTSRP